MSKRPTGGKGKRMPELRLPEGVRGLQTWELQEVLSLGGRPLQIDPLARIATIVLWFDPIMLTCHPAYFTKSQMAEIRKLFLKTVRDEVREYRNGQKLS